MPDPLTGDNGLANEFLDGPDTGRPETDLVRALAGQGARLETLIRLLSAVSRLSGVPLRSARLSEAAGLVLEIIIEELSDVENASLLMYDPRERKIKLLAARGVTDDWVDGEEEFNRTLAFDPGQGLAGSVFVEGRPLFYNQGQPRTGLLLNPEMTSPKSLACLPLSALDSRLGVLNISFVAPQPFDHPQRRELIILGGVAANVIQALSLQEEVIDKAGQLRGQIKSKEEEIIRRLAVEAELRGSLEEKDVLLREIHHRVKNNLQIMSSLFYLQSQSTTDGRDLEILKECQDRVRSMALVHERLYQSDDLSQIELGEYLRQLGIMLGQSYGQAQRRIDLAIKTEPALVGVDTAIPLGLIATELVSNAFKHAYPDGGPGRIGLTLSRSGAMGLNLVVNDEGVGLPEGLNLTETGSLGLKLVNILVEQLGANLDVIREHGVEFRIRLDEPGLVN